tara:strand:- start:85 stop:477 length:393 start_codon:yes stop_codon:yes gene_type:complete
MASTDFTNRFPLGLSYTSPHGGTFPNALHEIFRLDWNISRTVASGSGNVSTCRAYIRVYVDKDAWATMKTPLTTYHFDFTPNSGSFVKVGTATCYHVQAYTALKDGSVQVTDSTNTTTTANYSGASDVTV